MIISHGSYCPGSEAVFIHHVTKARNKPGNEPGGEPGNVPRDEHGNEPRGEPGDVPGDEPHQPEFCPICYDSKCWPGNKAKCLSLFNSLFSSPGRTGIPRAVPGGSRKNTNSRLPQPAAGRIK